MEPNDPRQADGPGRGFYQFTATRPVAITMVAVTVLVFGIASLGKLRLNLLPDISYPTITVRTQYPGAAPEDVEERVTERLQEALATTSNLVRIWSVSRAEVSDIVLEFTWGTRITFAMQDVREKLDRVFLPQETEKPILLRYDPNLDPILRIGVSGEPDLRKLRRLARDDLKRELEGLPGVAAVRLRGGLEDEVRVAVDTREIAKRNLPFDLVRKRLGEENLNAPAGKVEEGDKEFLVRTLNQFLTVDDIANIVLANIGDAEVRLRDVARVEPYHRDRDVVVRIDGAEAVELAIDREADANIVDLAERVKERIFGAPEQKAFCARLDSGALDAEYRAADAEFDNTKNPPKEAVDRHDELVRRRKADREANTNFLARKMKDRLQLTILSDQSRFIRDALEDVQNSALVGGILAVLILYLYLRRFTDTAVIALSIPISVIATFAPMFLMHVSLNVMSLGGLALGIGMIVDDAIVVLESISRCRHEGDGLIQAAVRGVSEVAGAVTASTLTAMAVFFPIVFVEGIAGQLFGDQALTVVVSRFLSLLFALFFIPMLASRRLREIGEGRGVFSNPFGGMAWRNVLRWIPNLLLGIGRTMLFVLATAFRGAFLVAGGLWWLFQKAFTPIQVVFDLLNNSLERVYPNVLRAALRVPWLVILAAVGLMAVTASRVGHLGTQLLPDVHQGEFTAEVHLAVGTPVEKTDSYLLPLATDLRKLADVDQVILASGVERDALASSEEGDHTGKLTIRVTPGDPLPLREEALIERVREYLGARPEIRQIRFKKPTLFSLSTPVEIEVRGRDLDVLTRLGNDVEKVLESEPSLSDIRSSLRRGNPEVAVRFRREEMLRYRLDATAVANLLRGAVLGDVATTFVEGDQRIDIRVRATGDEIAGLDKLGELAVNPGQSPSIPLKAVADLQVREGRAEIRRIGNTRAAVVTANTNGFDLGGLSDRLTGKLASLEKPPGYDIEIGGQKREMERALRSMRFALLLAVFLVYIVMAAQFESVLQPLVILVTVPLSIVGLEPTLELTKTPISVVALLGAILLGGIVVANAIVLLARANQNRAKGMDETDALVEAGRVRLRPILMTAFTTILGLLPMTGWLHWIPYIGRLGSGEGAELRAPMAIVVVAGLTSSTVLTLLVIPVVDSLVHRITIPKKPKLEPA
jgi:HAE1 family hydrophobic/amphiphilic exporter-1